MKFFLLFFSMAVLKCCWGPTDYQLIKMQQNDDTILKVLNGTYQINTLKGEDVSSYKLNITFNDSTKQVSGFSGCNRFFGSYTSNDNTLKFGAIGSTKMLCDDNANNIETTLLKGFEKANLILFTKNGFSFYDNKKLILSANKDVLYESLKIEYSAISRGTYKQIIIDNKTVSTIEKRGGKPIIKACNKEDWDTIIKALNHIDINTMSTLEAPSKKFQFDGAAIAHLKITVGKNTNETPPFDHGNPHKDIVTLVNKILSISENIE